MTEQKQPFDLPDAKPPCFESAEQWRDYQHLWRLSQGTGRVHYCHDCLPEYRDRMIEQGRCAHPETVFVESNEGVVGVSGVKWGTWIESIAGKRGNIISPPDRRVRDNFIAEAVRGNSGKAGGGGYKRLTALKVKLA